MVGIAGKESQRHLLHRMTISIALVCMWWLAVGTFTGSAIQKDAGQNLQLALNLAHHGVMSIDEAPPYRPSMTREPVPIAAIAAAVVVVDAIDGRAPDQSYFAGRRAQQLKFVNVLWLTLLAIATFLATRHFTSKFYVALLAAMVVAAHFTVLVPVGIRGLLGIDTLLTEVAGAALTISASFLFAKGIASHRQAVLAAAGVVFGLAALTKASLFYVCIALLVAAAVASSIVYLRTRASRPLRGVLALAIPFFLVTSSWMYRNYVQTGYWQISERGGEVLLYRAYMDEMTPQEILGAFVVWSDPHLTPVLSRLTGYTSAALQMGGPLQRIFEGTSGEFWERELRAEESGRPEEARTWYRKARATREAYISESMRQGYAYPSGEADLRVRKKAVQRILRTPLKHVALIPLLVWRGAPLIFAILIVAHIHAWPRQRMDFLSFITPATLLAIFYGATSQFTPRYAESIYPIAVIVLGTLVAPVLDVAVQRRFPQHSSI